MPNGSCEALPIKFGDPRGVWSRGSRFEVAALYSGADGQFRRTRMVATFHAGGMEGFLLDDVRHEAD
jgi:hypothetical protein